MGYQHYSGWTFPATAPISPGTTASGGGLPHPHGGQRGSGTGPFVAPPWYRLQWPGGTGTCACILLRECGAGHQGSERRSQECPELAYQDNVQVSRLCHSKFTTLVHLHKLFIQKMLRPNHNHHFYFLNILQY